MREIKFRAWDKEANIMIYSDHRTRKLYDVYYGFGMNGQGELECGWEGEWNESNTLDEGTLDNLMQYTGLKDKNGKEIYEGDVVKVVIYGKEDCGAVRYSEMNATYYLSLEERSDSELWLAAQIEIIGNIHENAELMEEE